MVILVVKKAIMTITSLDHDNWKRRSSHRGWMWRDDIEISSFVVDAYTIVKSMDMQYHRINRW